MGSSLKIQKLHLLNVQVSEFPPIPTFSMFNFISSSWTRSFPQFRTSFKTSLPFNKLYSLSLSSSPAPVSLSENSSNERSFEVSYLINTFGWSPELAISRAKYVKFNTSEKPDNVLALLTKHGFTQTQISSIVEKNPRLILCDPQNTLLPKLEFLSSIGLSTTEIVSCITAIPCILVVSVKKSLIPLYNLLLNLVGSDDKAVEMIKQYPVVLTCNPVVENIQILLEVGVPKENIVASMKYQHRGRTPTDTFRMIVERVKEMGIDPSHLKFVQAIRSIWCTGDYFWERKVQALKKYGWSDREILLAFKKAPLFMTTSEDKIVAVMDFLVNRMGMEVATIANRPTIFCYSLEKRIIPRCLVYQVLLEKGFFNRKRNQAIETILRYTENKFISRVIELYENEAPELLNFYQEMLSESK